MRVRYLHNNNTTESGNNQVCNELCFNNLPYGGWAGTLRCVWVCHEQKAPLINNDTGLYVFTWNNEC